MKKLFSVFLCLLLLFSVVSCTNPSNTGAPENPQESDPYQAIIEKYKELLICKQNNTVLPEASENDSLALKMVYELAKKCENPLDMAYAKKDINNDGYEELIFTESTLNIVAIFTVKNNEAVPLIMQENVNTMIWLDANGLVRMKQFVMEGQYWIGLQYFVYEISNGELKMRVAIGCDAMEEGDWHKIENGRKISISEEEWHALYSQYNIRPFGWDERECTKNYADLTVLPLLEAATPRVQTYLLATIIKNDRVSITSVSSDCVSFTMLYYKYSELTELSATARLTDGKYLFDNGTIKGSIEFGYDSIWVNINESTNEHIDCRSYLFDYVTSN